jgi:MFS family permease
MSGGEDGGSLLHKNHIVESRLPTTAPAGGPSNAGRFDDSASDSGPPTEITQEVSDHDSTRAEAEARLRLKVDIRLCSIAGILCSLNLLDSGIISSAAVTSMLSDLNLTGDRYSVSIFIFTVASICCQLPATILLRFIGPRLFFSATTCAFGVITMCTAAITSWQQMIALRVLLGISMSGIYPGLTYLISTWYTRHEQQLRFALLQSGEIIVLATGSIVNFGLNHLDHRYGIRGWQWMYLVQGAVTVFLGLITFFWMIDFPDRAEKSFHFLTGDEKSLALSRINDDRGDAGKPEPFRLSAILVHFLDPKLYAFCVLFFLLNIVSTALSYFLPIILQSGMGFSSNKAILLSSPPYYYSVLPVLLSSYVSDKYRVRAPIIIFNAICLIVGFCMLGFPSQVTVRYIGTFLATGAYISNWAALNSYQSNNIVGQWKRATVAAAISACNGLGGIAGSYIVRQPEAPRYLTAIWVSIGSHILMIAVVLVCTVFFWRTNRRVQRKGGTIEGSLDFRYTY